MTASSDDELSTRVERLIAAARAALATEGSPTDAHLREAVWAYVDALRALRVQPERMVIAVKDVLGRGGLLTPTRRERARPTVLYECAIRWSIERYYSDTHLGNTPRKRSAPEPP